MLPWAPCVLRSHHIEHTRDFLGRLCGCCVEKISAGAHSKQAKPACSQCRSTRELERATLPLPVPLPVSPWMQGKILSSRAGSEESAQEALILLPSDTANPTHIFYKISDFSESNKYLPCPISKQQQLREDEEGGKNLSVTLMS